MLFQRRRNALLWSKGLRLQLADVECKAEIGTRHVHCIHVFIQIIFMKLLVVGHSCYKFIVFRI